MNNLKVAIVHDWIASYTGGEKCVESFLNIWKDADLFTLVNLYEDNKRFEVFNKREPKTSFLQKNNWVKKNYRKFLLLFPYAIERFDLSNYDLIISSSSAVAKGVITNANQLHICYCHTPMRYAWDLSFQYLKEAGLTKGIEGLFAKIVLHYLRMWDVTSSNRVDYFIANSKNISKRINKIYRRNSEVICPPVDTSFYTSETNKDDYFITVSRFVPYKKIDILIEAFNEMPDKKLIIIGEGPDEKKLRNHAKKNVEILNYQHQDKLKLFLQKAKAFIFAAEEDFGISIIEALSCGTPVIAFNKGGAAETISNGQTGVLFNRQDKGHIIDAINEFESGKYKFDPNFLSAEANKYSKEIFEEKIKKFVELKLNELGFRI